MSAHGETFTDTVHVFVVPSSDAETPTSFLIATSPGAFGGATGVSTRFVFGLPTFTTYSTSSSVPEPPLTVRIAMRFGCERVGSATEVTRTGVSRQPLGTVEGRPLQVNA